jgi:hypothetical protein
MLSPCRGSIPDFCDSVLLANPSKFRLRVSAGEPLKRIKYVTEEEEAAISLVLMEHIARFPEHKTDPVFESLFKKFNVDIDRMLRGLDPRMKTKVADVLADLDDATLSIEEIAKKHDVTVSVVQEVKRLSEQRA